MMTEWAKNLFSWERLEIFFLWILTIKIVCVMKIVATGKLQVRQCEIDANFEKFTFTFNVDGIETGNFKSHEDVF